MAADPRKVASPGNYSRMSQNPSLRRAAAGHATRSFADKYGYGTAGSDQAGADERMMGGASHAQTVDETVAANQNSLPEINIKQSNQLLPNDEVADISSTQQVDYGEPQPATDPMAAIQRQDMDDEQDVS